MRMTQDERRAQTSDKLITTAIELIARQGLSTLTTKRISEEAGVSWGAAQYLFGNKEGFYKKVGSRILDELIAQTAVPNSAPSDRGDAIRAFAELVWNSFCSDTYVAWIEFVRNFKDDAAMRRELEALQDRYIEHFRALWIKLTGDEATKEQEFFVMHHVILTLSGLASRRIFLHDRIEAREHINLLVELISERPGRASKVIARTNRLARSKADA